MLTPLTAGICSLLGNSTLLYVSYKKKHLLKPAEYLIINLAVSDLGLTLFLYPLAITSSFYHRCIFYLIYSNSVCPSLMIPVPSPENHFMFVPLLHSRVILLLLDLLDFNCW